MVTEKRSKADVLRENWTHEESAESLPFPDNPMGHLEIQSGKGKWRLEPSRDLRVGDDLDEEFAFHALIFGRYTSLLGIAMMETFRRREALEKGEALARAEVRRDIERAGERATEQRIADALSLRPDIAGLRSEAETSRVMEAHLKGLIEALRHKKEAMIAIGANRRAEIGDLRFGEVRATSQRPVPGIQKEEVVYGSPKKGLRR